MPDFEMLILEAPVTGKQERKPAFLDRRGACTSLSDIKHDVSNGLTMYADTDFQVRQFLKRVYTLSHTRTNRNEEKINKLKSQERDIG